MTAKEKRIERKKKLKRVFNFDSEMKFLNSFWELKSKKTHPSEDPITLEEFEVLVMKTLVSADQVSDVVLEYFIEEVKLKHQISDKALDIKKAEHELNHLIKEKRDLEDILHADDEPKQQTFRSGC